MNVSQSIQSSFSKTYSSLKTRKGLIQMVVFIGALIAFEAFNFSTTEFALKDLLGDLRFGGIRWATLLSIAFCGIDLAGVATLFAPQTEREEPRKTWFMFGAWLLAAIMNATLTWWGVVMAMQSHEVISARFVNANFVTKSVPIFIALMVWVIRILLVGSLSKNGGRLLQGKPLSEKKPRSQREFRQAQSLTAQAAQSLRSAPVGFKGTSGIKSMGKPGQKPEPTYTPMQEEMAYHSMRASAANRR